MSNRSRPDFYTQKAKKEGYMARSVYKLEEIQNKTRLIKPGDTVLDVGASPGSWTQYVLRLLKGKGKVVGADLKPPGKLQGKGRPLLHTGGCLLGRYYGAAESPWSL